SPSSCPADKNRPAPDSHAPPYPRGTASPAPSALPRPSLDCASAGSSRSASGTSRGPSSGRFATALPDNYFQLPAASPDWHPSPPTLHTPCQDPDRVPPPGGTPPLLRPIAPSAEDPVPS